jgi:bisphosphoglycerate-independent phosphoglycerate mutase (AlkP superfamily)
MLFSPGWPKDTVGAIAVTGETDNSGNESVLSKLMSSKFPLIVILTEVCAQLKRGNFEMDLKWIPRGQNELADALTNKDFKAFSRDKRMHVEVADLGFIILPQMIDVAEHLYEKVKIQKTEREMRRKEGRGEEGRKAKPSERLKAREPW